MAAADIGAQQPVDILFPPHVLPAVILIIFAIFALVVLFAVINAEDEKRRK